MKRFPTINNFATRSLSLPINSNSCGLYKCLKRFSDTTSLFPVMSSLALRFSRTIGRQASSNVMKMAVVSSPTASFHSIVSPRFPSKGATCNPVFYTPVRFMSKERAGKAVKPGAALVVDGAPHKVLRITQGKRGKGGGYVRAFLKNIITKNTFEKTYLVDETVEYANLEKEEVQYSWNDGENFFFMNSKTFEEVSLTKEDCPEWEFLSEGMEVKVQKFNDQVIGVELAKVCEFEIVSVDPQKQSSGFKAAIVGNGAEIFVPMFIEPGTKVRINVVDREYVERA